MSKQENKYVQRLKMQILEQQIEFHNKIGSLQEELIKIKTDNERLKRVNEKLVSENNLTKGE